MRQAWLIAAALVVGGFTPAWSQTVFEGAAGYNVTEYRGATGTPVGWFVSFSARPTPWFAVVSQLTAEFQTVQAGKTIAKKHGFAFLDGPRLTIPRQKLRGRAELFGEVLIGVAHDGDFFPDRADANRFVWQPGTGADLAMSDRLSARFQINWRFPCCDEGGRISMGFLSGITISSRRPVDAVEDAIRRQTKAKQELARAEDRHATVVTAATTQATAVADARTQLAAARGEERATSERTLQAALLAFDRANAEVKEAAALLDIARDKLKATSMAIDTARADLASRR